MLDFNSGKDDVFVKLRKINTHSLQLFSQLLVYCCHPNHQRAVAPPGAPKEHSCSQLHAKAHQHYRKTSFLSTVIKLEKEQARGLRMRQATKSRKTELKGGHRHRDTDEACVGLNKCLSMHS